MKRWSRYFKITDIHTCCKSRIWSYQFGCYRAPRYLLCHYLVLHEAVLLALDMQILYGHQHFVIVRTVELQPGHRLHHIWPNNYICYKNILIFILTEGNIIWVWLNFLTYSTVTYAKEHTINSGIWNILKYLNGTKEF
jgi:hypothetical protein